MSYYERKIRKIINSVEANRGFKPRFNPRKWKGKKLNCYAYALDIPIADEKKEIFFPGCICDKNASKDVWNDDDIIGGIQRDLDFLKISYREDDGIIDKGEWKIAIYFIASYHDMPMGFHIARLDDDGCWSEKPSWKRKVQRIGEKGDTAPDLSEYGPELIKTLILKWM